MIIASNIPNAPYRDSARIAEDERSRRQLMAVAKAKGWHRFVEPNYNVNYSARLYSPHYENVWDQEQPGQPQSRWMDTPGGRAGIRVVSRGLFGTAGITLGDKIVEDYVPTSSIVDKIARGENYHEGPLNAALNGIAKVYDVTFGWPIKKIFGEEAVTFRNNRSFGSVKMGRTYGEEAVGVTLAFALGSVGDAWGRNFVGLFDPNVKKTWIHDGRVNFKEFAVSTVKSAGHILAFNQMEDWVAAIPYVYQMKAQRHVLEKFRPGSQLMLEHGLNGATQQINREGRIIGDYAGPGALDLQLRFTGYNVYTLMFRDAYNHVKHTWQHRHDPEKPHDDVKHNPIDEALKYVAKSAIKASIYMTPAVPFFWLFRTGHALNDAGRIMAGEFDQAGKLLSPPGMVEIKTPDKKFRRYSYHLRHYVDGDMRIGRNAEDKIPFQADPAVMTSEYLSDSAPSGFSNYENKSPTARLLTHIGQPMARAGSFLGDKLTSIKSGEAFYDPSKDFWKINGKHHKLTQRLVSNAGSYTPYMIAKYETANIADTPQMDSAVYRVLDGMDHGRWSEVKAGAADMVNVVRRLPVSVETEHATHEARGMINSTQQSRDSDDIRDGHIVKSFAQKQHENKLERLRNKPAANVNAAPAANTNAEPGSRVVASAYHGRVGSGNDRGPSSAAA